MAQLDTSLIVPPFGEVDVIWTSHRNGVDGLLVKAFILLPPPQVEGAQTGLAIDGSNSMLPLYGANVPPLFRRPESNVVQPVARMMAEYLAKFDADGNTTVIHWACGLGDSLEIIGDMNAEQARSFRFTEPKAPGKGTRLMPAVRYFADEKFPNAPWGIYVFLTDGIIEDLDQVKQYSLKIGKELADGKRQFIKFVLIGLGTAIDEDQMVELDDLDYGGLETPNGDPVDLWDHTTAAEMTSLDQIFKECVSSQTIVLPSAQITDSTGKPVRPLGDRSFADGLPALVEFYVAPESTSFTLTLPDGTSFTQPLK